MMGACLTWTETELFTAFFRFVSWFGDGIVPILLVVGAAVYFYLVKKEVLFAVILSISPLVGQVVKSLLKNYLQIQRPEAQGCIPLTSYGDEFALPSGHTIFYVIFFGLLAYYYSKNLRSTEGKIALPISIALILTIGLSRVYLRAHWYTDVLAGYLVGGVILFGAILVYSRLLKRGGKR